jgi:putative transposase
VLTAIIDLHTRFVLNWHLSITRYELVYQSLWNRKYGVLEIFNTDQGSQYTIEIHQNAFEQWTKFLWMEKHAIINRTYV